MEDKVVVEVRDEGKLTSQQKYDLYLTLGSVLDF